MKAYARTTTVRDPERERLITQHIDMARRIALHPCDEDEACDSDNCRTEMSYKWTLESISGNGRSCSMSTPIS